MRKVLLLGLVSVMIFNLCSFNVLAETEITALYPSVATYVYSSSPNKSFGDETIFLAGRNRYGYVQFDISEIKGKSIVSAALKGLKHDKNSNRMGIVYVPDDSAVTNELTYNTRPSVPAVNAVKGNESPSNMPFDINDLAAEMEVRGAANSDFSGDITDLVYNELDKPDDNMLSLFIYPFDVGVDGGSSAYASEFYKKSDANDEASWFRIEVETTDDPDYVSVIEDFRKIVILDESGEPVDLGAVESNLILPPEGESGQTTITWTSSDPDIISDDGIVNRPLYVDGNRTVRLTANVTKGEAAYSGDFEVTVISQEMTDESRVELDYKNSVEIYNNTTLIFNPDFVKEGENGSAITWESSMPQYVSNDGVVVRPKENESSADVKITVTISYGEVTKTYDITVHIPKEESENTETMLKSVEDVYNYAMEYVNNTAEGTAPGQFDPGIKAKALNDIEGCYLTIDENSGYAYISGVINQIKALLKNYIGTAVLSDKVIDAENNALEFSGYRVHLMQSVAEGQINLLTEPDMYTDSAKYALKEYLDYCISVLDGTYKRPFTRNRSFLTPRLDEAIQFALQRCSKTYLGLPIDGSVIGIDAMNRWYLTQHMVNGMSQSFSIYPTDDTFVNSGNNNFGGDSTVIAGNGRVGLVKFDLSSIGGQLKRVYLKLWNTTTNNPDMVVCKIPGDVNSEWSEGSITAKKWMQLNNASDIRCLLDKTAITYFKPGGKDAGCSVDVTNAALEQLSGDKSLGLCFWVEPNTKNPPAFYSKENSASGKRLCLTVETDVVDKKALESKYKDVTGKADEMIDNAVAGTGIGEYPPEVYNKLIEERAKTDEMYNSGDATLIAKQLVALYNAMRNMRYAQVLRSDVEEFSNLYFTEQDALNFANKVNRFAVLKDQYNYLKQVSDRMDMSMIDKLSWIMNEDHPREEINQYFKLISGTPNHNFTPPSKTAYGTLEILLPNAENELGANEGKVGHVWIDTVSIAVSGYDNIDIKNSGFDEGTNVPDNWEYVSYSGNPKFDWETRSNYVDAGGHSVYIENPTNADSGGIRYTEKLKLYPGVRHTLTFRHKIDEKLVEGVKFVITYYDKNDTAIGTFSGYSNKKSSLGNQLLEAQADAIVYAVEKDPYYAEKAKKRLLFSINDFNQGAEHWMIKNSRPDGIDAYGEVQGGRIMASICAVYTLIKDSGVFTEEEYSRFISGCEYLARFLLDLRDRTEGKLSEATVGGNWLTDQACGAGMYGLAFPDEKHSRMFFTNGMYVLNGQLDITMYEDGAWPESIRYAGAVINKFGPFARAINIACGYNWWATTKLPRIFGYLIQSSTPPYVFFNGKISEPPFGDNTLKEGSNIFASMGTYYDQVSQADVKLSEWMYKTWVMAGYPMNSYGGESLAIQNFFSPVDFNIESNNPLRLSDYQTTNTGEYIFRENYGRDNAKYFIALSNDTALGHGHYDQGSFMLYANSVPLVMDPGIENYFNATKSWYVNTQSHSALLFTSDGTTPAVGPATSKRDSIFKSDEIDCMRIITTWPRVGNSVDSRNFALIEDGFNAVVIWDQIKKANNNTIFNLPVVAKSSSVDGNVVTSKGFYNTDLRTTVLEPKNPSIETMWMDTTQVGPSVGGANKMNYIQSTANKDANHLVILEPLKTSQKSLVITELETGAEGISAYRLQKVDGTYAIILTNNADSARSVDIDSEKNMIDMQTGKKFTVADGKVKVSAEGSKITVLKSEDVAAPRKTAIEITGPASIQIPTVGDNIGKYEADVISQYNNTIMSESVVWSIKENIPGVSVDKETGIVKVSSSAQINTVFTLAASSDGIQAEKRVKLNASNVQRASLEITGPDAVTTVKGETSAVLYTAQVYDRFGAPVEDNIEWSLHDNIEGVYISDGVLYVSDSVPEQTKITVIAKSASSTSALSSKTVVVKPREGSNIELIGKTYVGIPSSGTIEYDYAARIVDQNGNVFGNQDVIFELVSDSSRVQLNGSTLSIGTEAVPDTEIKIQVISKENSNLSRIFSIYTAANLPEFVEIDGETSITAPKSGYDSYKYSVTVKDINSNPITVKTTYSLDKEISGVRIDPQDGTLTVYSTARSASFKVLARVDGFENEIWGELEVDLSAGESSSSQSGGGGSSGGGGGGSIAPSVPNKPAGPTEVDKDSVRFNDVTEDYWAYAYINKLGEKEIICGDENNNFNPDNSISRAEFVKMLEKALGLHSDKKAEFSDVKEESWYYNSVSAVAASGLIYGYENNTFRPDNAITREEIALILERAVSLKGISCNRSGEIGFSDKDCISDYAENAVEVMISLGLISGFPDNTFKPKSYATRAETSAVICRLIDLLHNC
ncbi:MAG: S-layer homology domain-containing protein [Clostridia bacterium]|nr:S-layer homology domain-containing protein [Clostridia bacterium]